MSSFPFSRLPILVQLLILKNCSLLELIDFSSISRKSKKIVKSLGLTPSFVFWKFDKKNSCHEIHLKSSRIQNLNSKEFRLYTVLEFEFPPGYEELEFHNIVINGNRLLSARRETPKIDKMRIDNWKDSNHELMDLFIDYLKQIFILQGIHLKLENFTGIREYFIWNHSKNFATLEVRNTSASRVILTSDDMKFILEELKIDDLSFSCSIDPEFKYSGALRMRRLNATDAHWLTLEAMLAMDCKSVSVSKTSFSYKDLNAIVKKWMDGGLEKLVWINIQDFNPIPGDSRDTKLEHILEGIETFPWDANNRPSIGFRNGRDMRRSDGILATVDLHQSDNLFRFRVWHPESV